MATAEKPANSRFVCEVPSHDILLFEAALADIPHARIGEVTDSPRLTITAADGSTLIDQDLATLKEAWQAPLRW